MKLPNHYGTITKLAGKRRRPYIIREGQSGKQKPIGYACTREEALDILAKYNKNPWDIQADKITLQELYDLWLEKRAVKLGTSNLSSLKSAYKHCAALAKYKYNQIKSYQMQDTIDSCGHGYSTQGAIKNLWGHLDRFAMELDVISKQYSDLLTSDPIPETTKEMFTDEEVKQVWELFSKNTLSHVDSVIFFLYTGFRISEFLNIKVQDVDFENNTITGGVKTAAGRGRIVPIHSKILSIVKSRAAQSVSGYLFEQNGKRFYATTYYKVWESIMAALGIERKPHECRHTLRSRLDSAGANKVCIDRIIGHKSKSVGERVYTHKTIKELHDTIELVTN